MKRKNAVRILAVLLSILFVIPCVSLSTTAAEAERTYANAPVLFYLTYDETTGKPVAKSQSTSSTSKLDGEISFRPYTDWQNCAFGGDENGFLTIKPEKTNSGFIVDLMMADDNWCAVDSNQVKYFTMYYKVVGEDTTENWMISVAPMKNGGFIGGFTAAEDKTLVKDNEWNYFSCQSSTFDTNGGGKFRLQCNGLTNPDSYIVIDYIAYVASEEEALKLKKNHDDYLAEVNNPISAVYQTRKEAGLARNNVIYFDGYSADSMAAGYLNNVRIVSPELNREVTSGITIERPNENYDDIVVSATVDGHIRVTTKTLVNDCAIDVTLPENTVLELKKQPEGIYKYLSVRYRLENGTDTGAGERGYLASGLWADESSITYPAGKDWQMAIGQLSKGDNSWNKFTLYLPSAMHALGASMVIDYIGFFDTEADAREEYKIQSLADGVDVGFAGVQSWKEGNEASVRFVGKLDVISDADGKPYTSVGFDLTANDKPNKTPIAAEVVYESILAGGKTVTAESLGTSYLFTYVVNGMDATKDEDITFTVTPYAYYNGRKISGPTYQFRYNPSTDAFSAISD